MGDGGDVEEFVPIAQTSSHHLRRTFTSLAGMPLSSSVRWRPVSLAAAAVVAGDTPLLSVAVRSGYRSTEAFGRTSVTFSDTPREIRAGRSAAGPSCRGDLRLQPASVEPDLLR
ncbi:hypothetical protein [Egicoccus halophilus]|uniref:hypothetical protein n=1 Tax=Egicoccus halophilus TaxID=1670830 RepID=UPI001665D469|nr:hypothetical protein [Egicoccus halophilus]